MRVTAYLKTASGGPVTIRDVASIRLEFHERGKPYIVDLSETQAAVLFTPTQPAGVERGPKPKKPPRLRMKVIK